MKRDQVHIGVRVRNLRNFEGVPEGTEGIIDELYGSDARKTPTDSTYTGFMVAWDLPDRPIPPGYLETIRAVVQRGERVISVHGNLLRDGFSLDRDLDTLEAIAGPLPGGYWHNEAFCLMMYECTVCGTREQIWNSRDGVTPFTIHCQRDACNEQGNLGCPMSHTDWHLDKRSPEFYPHRGMRIFIDVPEAVALAYARIRWNEYLFRCEADGTEPHDLENGLQRLFEDIYKDGRAPWIMTL